MPLTYDDIPGSWGHYSTGWPFFRARDEAHARRAFVACTKECVVPYGSYVMVGLDIRVETQGLLDKLTAHMRTARIEDTDEIVRRVNEKELKCPKS